jgi:hypothetical protein
VSEETVLAAPTAAEIRDELEQLVRKDLHGPLGGEFEEFGERPTDRYPLGRLAPDGTVIEPDEQDETAESGAGDFGEDHPEPTAPNIVSLAPSALGCTVYVAGDTQELRVTAEWARYDRGRSTDENADGPVWRRIPVPGGGPPDLDRRDAGLATAQRRAPRGRGAGPRPQTRRQLARLGVHGQRPAASPPPR